jgi:probable rRNA maturation factor
MRVRLSVSGEKALHGLSLSFLRRVVRETCTAAFPRVFVADRGVILDVACVSDQEIATLNARYRKKARPTDILSFGSFATPREVSRVRDRTIDIGQIILSPGFIARSAREDSVSWKREFTFVFSHGVLHLLGYDHSPRMFALQNRVTDQLAPPEA